LSAFVQVKIQTVAPVVTVQPDTTGEVELSFNRHGRVCFFSGGMAFFSIEMEDSNHLLYFEDDFLPEMERSKRLIFSIMKGYENE